MKKKKIKKLKWIPYQLCPKCNGEGNMFVSNIHPSTLLSAGWQNCDVCYGQKIIPMHEIKEK